MHLKLSVYINYLRDIPHKAPVKSTMAEQLRTPLLMVQQLINKLQWASKSEPGSHECLFVRSQIKRCFHNTESELCDNTSSQAAWYGLFTPCAKATKQPFHNSKTGPRVVKGAYTQAHGGAKYGSCDTSATGL